MSSRRQQHSLERTNVPQQRYLIVIFGGLHAIEPPSGPLAAQREIANNESPRLAFVPVSV
jgi:hypothetical protein